MSHPKLDNIESLLEKPVFTSKEANELGVSPSLLCYYIQKGFIPKTLVTNYTGDIGNTLDPIYNHNDF